MKFLKEKENLNSSIKSFANFWALIDKNGITNID